MKRGPYKDNDAEAKDFAHRERRLLACISVTFGSTLFALLAVWLYGDHYAALFFPWDYHVAQVCRRGRGLMQVTIADTS